MMRCYACVTPRPAFRASALTSAHSGRRSSVHLCAHLPFPSEYFWGEHHSLGWIIVPSGETATVPQWLHACIDMPSRTQGPYGLSATACTICEFVCQDVTPHPSRNSEAYLFVAHNVDVNHLDSDYEWCVGVCVSGRRAREAHVCLPDRLTAHRARVTEPVKVAFARRRRFGDGTREREPGILHVPMLVWRQLHNRSAPRGQPGRLEFIKVTSCGCWQQLKQLAVFSMPSKRRAATSSVVDTDPVQIARNLICTSHWPTGS